MQELVSPQAGIMVTNIFIEGGLRRSGGLLITVNVEVAFQL